MSNFYVGQKVVSIVNHSGGYFKKGDEFKITATRNGCCEAEVSIDNNFYTHISDCDCGKSTWETRPWFYAKCFRPLQEISDFTYNEAINYTHKEDLITVEV